MKTHRRIFCCACDKHVMARLTSGAEIYPTRSDLRTKPFWRCDTCTNYVGTHHNTAKPTRPLGCIPSEEIRKARQHLHALFDPIWQSGLVNRSRLYTLVAARLGLGGQFHIADIRDIKTARQAYRAIQDVAATLH